MADSESLGGARALVLRGERPAPRAVVLEGEIVGATPEEQTRLLVEIVERLVETGPPAEGRAPYDLFERATVLLGLALPYTAADLRRLLNALVDGGIRPGFSLRLLTRLMRHVERYTDEHGLPDVLRPLLERQREKVRPFPGANRYGRLLVRLERLLDPQNAGMPAPDEPWAAAMLADLYAMDEESLARWRSLLSHAAAVTQTRPTLKWLRATDGEIERVGRLQFHERALSWLAAAAEPHPKPLSERNTGVLKGMAWLCCTREDSELASALARLAEALLRWLTLRLDWRGLKAGNACLNALSIMPGPEPLAQLLRLSRRLKGRQLQTSLDRALEVAGGRRNLSREDLEELMVPAHGLDSGSCLRAVFDDVSVEIAVSPRGDLEWRWFAGGVERRSAPPSVRGEHAAENRALRAAAAEMRTTLAAQRARLEDLLLSGRSWHLDDWRSRYLDHPLLQPMVRALIWQVQPASGPAVPALLAGEDPSDAAGRPLLGLSASTEVRLWHPIGCDPDVVETWRRRLNQLGIVQPFKQVDREFYTLSAGELAAGVSARFAGRIVRQQQFSSLCRARGWQYSLQGPWHGPTPSAVRALPEFGLRAEFRLSLVETDRGDTDLGRTGYYPHVSTDVLRFRAPDGSPCLLTEVPDHVLSEMLRDVDLFVSVSDIETIVEASVDPAPPSRPKPARRAAGHGRRVGALPAPAG